MISSDAHLASSVPFGNDGSALNRRQFIGGASLASLAFLLPGWRAFATDLGATAEPSAPFALNPISPMLAGYQPPLNLKPMDQAARLDFFLFRWNSAERQGGQALRRMQDGAATVTREENAGQIVYKIHREIEGDFNEGEIVCRPGNPELVESWTSRWWRPEMPASAAWPPLEIKGVVNNGQATITEAGGNRVVAAPDGIVADASLWFHPATARTLAARPAYTRLDYMMIPRRSQRLRDAGAVPLAAVPSAQARMLTGPATLPSHLVRDAQDHPLFFTGLRTTFLLSGIS